MYKLLLINPSLKNNSTGLGAYKSTSNAPIALAYIASLTPCNYTIRILDENIEPVEYPDVDLVGITGYTAQIPRAYQIAKKFKSLNIPVVMGGIHVSMLPDEALNYCTSVVIGEAESVWKNVINDFENDALKEKYIGQAIDLKNLPVPDRSFLNNSKYLWGSVLTSKGCPMGCTFCSVTKFNGRKFRRRPVKSVVDELESIKNRFVFILDDNLLGYDDKEWLKEFFTELIRRKIRKYYFAQASMNFGDDAALAKLAHRAGVRLLVVGIESVDIDSLKKFNKNLNVQYAIGNQYLEKIRVIRKAGIAVLGCFILGGDTDDILSFGKTLRYIQKTHIDVLQLSKPTPLPGTKFYEYLENDNRIIDKNYPEAWKEYKFTRMLFKPQKLEIKDIYEGFYYIKKIFYSFPQRVLRILNTFIDTRSISTTFVVMLYDHTYKKSWKDSEIYTEYDMKILRMKFK